MPDGRRLLKRPSVGLKWFVYWANYNFIEHSESTPKWVCTFSTAFYLPFLHRNIKYLSKYKILLGILWCEIWIPLGLKTLQRYWAPVEVIYEQITGQLFALVLKMTIKNKSSLVGF